MKQIIVFILFSICLLLASCNGEIGKDVTSQDSLPATQSSQASLPDGCTSYLSYSSSKTSSTTTDSYGWLYVGVDDSYNVGWEMYEYDVYVSLNGKTWAKTSGTGFSVPRNTSTFYLKVVTYSMTCKNKNIFQCTSVSVYKNDTKQSSTCYVQNVD